MATEADLIQKFKDLNIPVGADFEELIHAAFASSNLADQINSKADDSKVVHTADMRKPANDVAGIEEVSTLQTQVDNSAVGTNMLRDSSDFSSNWDGYSSLSTTTEYNGHPSMVFITSNQQLAAYWISVGKLENSFKYTSSFWAKADNAGDKAHTELWGSIGMTDFVLTTDWVRYTAVLTSYSDANTSITHSRFYLGVPDGNKGNVYIALPKLEKGSVATDWCPNPSEILTQSDDSKVVHLSGAEEISGQKTFDVAPIDKATGNPYTTKSDVTTAINAATANMADDSKVVHRDPSTGVVSDSTTFSDLKVGNGQQVASIDVASSEQEATDKASKFTAPGIVIY